MPESLLARRSWYKFLKRNCHAHYGFENRRKLDWFREGWIEGTAIPELDAHNIRITEKNSVTTVTGLDRSKGRGPTIW